jgi:hypothetical protein
MTSKPFTFAGDDLVKVVPGGHLDQIISISDDMTFKKGLIPDPGYKPYYVVGISFDGKSEGHIVTDGTIFYGAHGSLMDGIFGLIDSEGNVQTKGPTPKKISIAGYDHIGPVAQGDIMAYLKGRFPEEQLG